MAQKIVATLTRADYPDVCRYRGRCTTSGCTEPEREYYATAPNLGLAHLRGWYQSHVLETGHTVVIEESQPEAPVIHSEDCRP